MSRVNMTGVRIDEDYAIDEDGRMAGCARCQDGAHFECHGCSCPCSYRPLPWGTPEQNKIAEAAWEEAVNAVRPRITVAQRRKQWKIRESLEAQQNLASLTNL
jgi:hypothetical protein